MREGECESSNQKQLGEVLRRGGVKLWLVGGRERGKIVTGGEGEG